MVFMQHILEVMIIFLDYELEPRWKLTTMQPCSW